MLNEIQDEPEYTADMLKWMNPDYEGKFGGANEKSHNA